MELGDRVIVITGAAGGIGRAMAERFAAEKPRGIALVDRDRDGARAVAESVGGLAIGADLTREDEVRRVIATTEGQYGPIDLYCSNAGIAAPVGGAEVPDEGWDTHWKLHVMAHVWAVRALAPQMQDRGGGHFLHTASAAGLLMAPGAAPYTVTKHAAVALTESLAVLHHDSPVRFSCLTPALVETQMVTKMDDTPVGRAIRAAGRALQPAEAAEIVLAGLRAEKVLILTHPENAEGMSLRDTDHEGYIAAMTGLWASVNGA